MAQKGAATKILILLVIALAGVAGYLVKEGRISLNMSRDIKIGWGWVDSMDQGTLKRLQQEVDGGHQPWRLDPVEVARVDGVKYGFSKDDVFSLLAKKFGEDAGTYIADVGVEHKGESYIISLIQPGTIGRGGVWVINGVVSAEPIVN